MLEKMRETRSEFGFNDDRQTILYFLAKGMEAEVLARSVLRDFLDEKKSKVVDFVQEPKGPAVPQDKASWQHGYDAGFNGKQMATKRPVGTDELAWVSGYIEGKAEREKKGGVH